MLLATFMGGMCAGSLLFPRIPAKFHPLRVYGLIELGIGAFGILVLCLIPHVGSVYTAWSGDGLRGFLLRGAVAAGCFVAPTMLMGATLPALARCFDQSISGVAWLGFIYGANIAGAVFGCLVSGFYLLREFDVTTATFAAVAVNAAAAALALVLGWRGEWRAQSDAEGLRPSESPALPLAVYGAIALSGFSALAAEAIWTRLLSLLLGASVYTLSIILTVFLTGLGIGSGIGSLLCRRLARPRLALALCQWLSAGAIAWTAYNLAAALPYWPIDPSIASNIWFNFQLDLARAFWALFPPTLLWGASFPLALGAAASKGQDGAILMARVYAANTLGAIAGALSATLVLMAWIGSQHTAQLLIAVSILAGVLLVPTTLTSRFEVVTAFLLLMMGGLLVKSVPPISKLLIAHGRYAATWAGKGEIIYAGEGVNSSVAVSHFPSGVRTFHVAGKIQASSAPRDMRLQRMLGHLTTLTARHPDSVLVIGCGAGITAGAVSIDPRVNRETIVEIEPLVPEAAATYFGQPNFDVLRNPKVQVRIDDGRHYLMTTKERFDGITVDPLDPWVKGAANLYTKEFLEVMKRHLNTGGTVTMYVQLFETNLDAVKSAVATFFEVFPNGTIWGNPYEGRGHDVVLLGQVEPLRIDLDEMERRAGYRGGPSRMAESLAEVGINSPEDLFATYAGRRSDLTSWLRAASINSDRNLRMQYLAGIGLNLDDAANIYAGMLAYRRFPEDVFMGAEGRVDSIRRAVQNGR